MFWNQSWYGEENVPWEVTNIADTEKERRLKKYAIVYETVHQLWGQTVWWPSPWVLRFSEEWWENLKVLKASSRYVCLPQMRNTELEALRWTYQRRDRACQHWTVWLSKWLWNIREKWSGVITDISQGAQIIPHEPINKWISTSKDYRKTICFLPISLGIKSKVRKPESERTKLWILIGAPRWVSNWK